MHVQEIESLFLIQLKISSLQDQGFTSRDYETWVLICMHNLIQEKKEYFQQILINISE